MKQFFYIITFFAFSFSLSAQQPVKPLLTKITATWCPNCGTWGWTAMKDVVERLHGDKASVLALHFSGDLADDLNKELASNFPAVGQPIFQNNGLDLNFSGSTYSTKIDDLEASIESETAMINAFNITKSMLYLEAEGNLTTFDVEVEVDADNLPSGDYSISAYIVRDDIIASQSGQSGDVAHFKIVDTAISSTFGAPYVNAGTYTFEYTKEDYGPITFDDNGMVEDLEIVIILWNSSGTNYEVVTTENSSIRETFVSNLNDVSLEVSANVFQNTQGKIEVNMSNNPDNAVTTANLFSITGRQLDSQSIENGKAYFESNNLLGRGLYIITLESEGQFTSYKVTVE